MSLVAIQSALHCIAVCNNWCCQCVRHTRGDRGEMIKETCARDDEYKWRDKYKTATANIEEEKYCAARERRTGKTEQERKKKK